MKGIDEQMRSNAQTAVVTINRQPPEEGARYLTVLRQLLLKSVGERVADHGKRGQRVVAGSPRARRVGQHEADGDVLSLVLAGLDVEVTVERFDAAVKGATVVRVIERDDRLGEQAVVYGLIGGVRHDSERRPRAESCSAPADSEARRRTPPGRQE